MKTLVVLLLLIIPAALTAQSKARFQSQWYGGIVKGENGHAAQVEVVNGIQENGWLGAIGIGYDAYHFNSAPLFLHASKYFFKQQRFFAQVNGGIALSWRDEQFIGMSDEIKHPAMPFYEGGLGCFLPFANDAKAGLLFNAGYSFKHVRERFPSTIVFDPVGGGASDRYDYRYHRLFLRLGLQF